MSFGTVFWVAPTGTTAVLDVTGEVVDAAELQWSSRCAAAPPTRAVVFVDGPGNDDPSVNFGTAHSVAEEVAVFVTDRSEEEVGSIEVLVFRPDTDHSRWPEPGPTADGVEFRFRHRGGADVHLLLTLPPAAEKGFT